MLSHQIEKLSTQSDKIIDTIHSSIDWVKEYKIVPAENKKAMVSALDKYRRDTERYKRALFKRPAIAIFGQSQVGKSYLVSNLAKRKEDKDLMITPQGCTPVDFMQMNPPGGSKEATGIVSRFTIDYEPVNPDFPYTLKLFSQCDIAKIILNGYFSDINKWNYSIDQKKIKETIDQTKAKVSNSEIPGFSKDDVLSLKEYLNDNFDRHIVRDLNKINFWEDISSIIPYISPEKRSDLLQLTWGENDFFTDIFNKCSITLRELNFSRTVQCNDKALSPNTDTLIDLERLRELYISSSKTDVEIYKEKQKLATVNRSVLSILTAEVILPLEKGIAEAQNREFLKEADILDFPGARSRLHIEESTFIERNDIEKLQVFIRGKVAYLFDMYNFDFEISTLVFCMDNTQPNVNELPHIVSNWVQNNHGENTQARQKREEILAELLPESLNPVVPLFVVQTKFNIDLKGNPATEKPHDPDSHNSKWEARLNENFNRFMMNQIPDQWANKWSQTDGSFKNMFLLRDPKWSSDVFEGYLTDAGVETAIKGDYVQKLKDMKTSFLAHPFSKKHFRNPEEAWEESCTLNKSGIDYIVKYMTPTCNPQIRLERLKTLINAQKDKVNAEFEHYVDTGDLASKLRKANVKGGKVFMFMMNWVKKTSGFGFFVDKLVLRENEAWQVYWNLKSAPPPDKPAPGSGSESIATLRQFFESYGIDLDESKGLEQNLTELKELLGIEYDEDLYEILKTSGIDLQKILEGGDKPVKTESERFAEKLIEHWFSKVVEIKNDPFFNARGLNKDIIGLICESLDKSKERVKLKQIIATQLKEEIERVTTSNDNYDLVAHISSAIINDYVNTVGWKFIDEDKNPDYPKIKNQPIFSTKGITTPKKESLDMSLDYPGMLIFNQWIWGMRESFKANVLFEEKAGNTQDALIKQKLAEILKRMN